ncbi:MAG: hypothetical protein QOE14_215 [Humisphaera sp.]|nr:hypothetical protein [Humisphaera sp.]
MQQHLDHALDQIAEIRRAVSRGQVFRGYRAQTTALTGVLAIVAAMLQSRIITNPWQQLPMYLSLWGGLAVVSAAIFGTELWIRTRRLASPLQTERTIDAAERFIPSLATGAILTVVYFRFIPAQTWMLPGLWAVCFSLGIFASRTLLPRGIAPVAGYYLIAGCMNLVLARGVHAFSPWAMGLTFGVGQLLAAAVLYWNLERRHGGQ